MKKGPKLNEKQRKKRRKERVRGSTPKQQEQCRVGMGTANKSDINGYLCACFLCACARVPLEYISRSQIVGSEGMHKFNLELSFKSGYSKKNL